MKKYLRVKRMFTFLVHGLNLLTQKTEQYFLIAKTMILIIAFTEALSWGYGFSLMASDLYMKVIAFFAVSTAIFLFIWALDATMMTLDRSKGYYDKKINPDDHDETPKKWLKLLKESKLFVGIGARGLMLFTSLLITSPFIDQLVFNKDITAVIEQKAKMKINQKRTELLKSYESQSAPLKDSVAKLKSLLRVELAGKGRSEKYGHGVVAKEYEKQIKIDSLAIVAIQDSSVKDIARYNGFVNKRDYENLRIEYALFVPQNLLSERSEAIKPILESDDAKKFVLTIRSFLLMLFAGLCMLKIFEPKGVRIYLSEALQMAYISYLNGGLDRLVPNEERANGKSPMTPYRFEHFMITTYANRNKKDIHAKIRQQIDELLQQARDNGVELENFLADGKLKVRDEWNVLNNSYNAANSAVSVQQNRLLEIDHQQVQHLAGIAECRAAISQLRKEGIFSDDESENSEEKCLQDIAAQKTKITELSKKIRECETERSKVNLNLAPLKRERDLKESELAILEAPLKEIEKAIRESKVLEKDIILKSQNYIKHNMEKLDEKPESEAEPV